jgi:hypothetical protein
MAICEESSERQVLLVGCGRWFCEVGRKVNIRVCFQHETSVMHMLTFVNTNIFDGEAWIVDVFPMLSSFCELELQ